MRPIRRFAALAAACLLIGCATKPPTTPPPQAAKADSAGTGVRVSLLWSAPVDLDLYVTDPSLESVYFGNPASQSGGRLDRDTSCDAGATAGGSVESVAWMVPPGGRYRVGVDFIAACGSTLEQAEFRVVADVSGRRIETSGTVVRERFQPIVVEFDVPVK